MAVYMYLTLALAAFAIVAASNPDCPPMACTMEFYPGQVHAASVMVYDNKICDICSKWMKPNSKTDDTGCPVIACTREAQQCPRVSYIAWEGKLCPSCSSDVC